MPITEVTIAGLQDDQANLAPRAGTVTLIVNVASECGLTPQYAGLERLQQVYAARGFTVLGVPCNQFGGQEPGTSEQIAQFCSTSFGVSFPLTEKVDVNGTHGTRSTPSWPTLPTPRAMPVTSGGTSRSS